ncbi:MAG TPA: hypothetical protein VGL46_09475 [Pseudonocardiaceae bacterium]
MTRKTKLTFALVIGMGLIAAASPLIYFHVQSNGYITVRNPDSSTSYTVPSDWAASALVLPVGHGAWGGLVDYGDTKCGNLGVNLGSVATSPYPPTGPTADPETAVRTLLPEIVTEVVGGGSSGITRDKPGPVRGVTSANGVTGAAIDIQLRGAYPECGPGHEIDRDIFTLLAFPSKESNGHQIMSMIWASIEYSGGLNGIKPLTQGTLQDITDSIRVGEVTPPAS